MMRREMKELSIDQIKEVELNLLDEFDKICEKNHLYYTLCGGTLLGAIRHKGFIPWDDDIDVLMPRPDYDRLLNNENMDFSGMPPYIEICHWKNGKLNYPFIKMVDARTRVSIDYYDDSMNINKIWIDIFPIDGNPDDEIQLKKIYNKSLKIRKVVFLKLAKAGEGKTLLKRILKPLIIRLLSVISFRRLCQKIDLLAKQYPFEESKYIGGILWGYGPQERIDRQQYMTPVKVEFEGKYFNAPSNYDEYLTGLYKDYMKLPPEDQRQVHGIHAYIINEK